MTDSDALAALAPDFGAQPREIDFDFEGLPHSFTLEKFEVALAKFDRSQMPIFELPQELFHKAKELMKKIQGSYKSRIPPETQESLRNEVQGLRRFIVELFKVTTEVQSGMRKHLAGCYARLSMCEAEPVEPTRDNLHLVVHGLATNFATSGAQFAFQHAQIEIKTLNDKSQA